MNWIQDASEGRICLCANLNNKNIAPAHNGSDELLAV
jgi:hypothetical protein